MRRFSTDIVFAFSIFLLFISIGSAQQTSTSSVPNLISYGGVLKDTDGIALASQTVGITFALYKQQDGGVALWTETRNVTTDAAGQYNVMLGSTKTEGVPAELFTDQEQRWLAVQVQGQPEPTRVLLVSVPYAFKAHEAETLGGLPASAFVKAAPDATSSESADAGLSVNALSTAGKAGSTGSLNKSLLPPPPGPCAATSTVPAANYIPMFINATPTECNSVIYQNGQGPLGFLVPNVGIGRIPGAARLDVNGNINVNNTKQAYEIGYNAVLTVVGVANLFVGLNAGINNPLDLNTGRGNTFLGSFAGSRNTIGSSNTFSGAGAGGSNLAGSNNAFFGASAGSEGSGSNNTFIGAAAGIDNTADSNTFVGFGAGEFNKSGTPNTCVGFEACRGIDLIVNSGASNTVVGYQAGYSNTVGNGNTLMGDSAGYSNIADGNSFFGYKSGFANTEGGENTFIGNVAGTANITGTFNTFVGDRAGTSNTLGNDNTFLGRAAGIFNTTGSENTFVGERAGVLNDVGSGNTFIGEGAGVFTTSGNGNTFSGNGAGGNNNTGYYNAAYGTASGYLTSTGAYNIFVGSFAGLNNTAGNNNIYIGNLGPTSGTESNTIRIGGDVTSGFGAQTDTYIAGIYNAPSSLPAKVVCVAQNGKLFSAVTLNDPHCGFSSRRFKEQILEMGDSSSKLLQLRPVTFFYKPQFDDGSHARQYGLIAEEVAKIYPEMAEYGKDGQPLTVNYQLLAPMLLNEFQKQHAVVTTQQTEMEALRDQTKAQQQQMLAQQQEIEGLKAQLQLQNAAFQQRLSRLESLVTIQIQNAAGEKPAQTRTHCGSPELKMPCSRSAESL